MFVTPSSSSSRTHDCGSRHGALSPSGRARGPQLESALRALAAIALASWFCQPHVSLAQSLRTDCVSSTVVGLRWDVPRGAPRSVAYEVRRDGVLLATTRDTVFVDTAVGPSTAYGYSLAMVSGRSDRAAPSTETIHVSTPAAPAEGDAPYCPSRAIKSIEFNWHGYTEPNGSDIWPVTWGRDGKVYTFFGDGGGFGGDNDRGRTSFGIASMAGTAPSDLDAAGAIVPPARRNIYGGFEAEHPSTVSGKAGSIIAVGRDFYGRGGIWNAAELAANPAPWSSPERVQIVYSRGNAYSWAAPTGCSARRRTGVGSMTGRAFVLDRSSTSAAVTPARRTGVFISPVFRSRPGSDGFSRRTSKSPAAETFLARVNKRSVLDASAYEYFAGLDSRGGPIWDRDPARMRPIFSDRAPSRPGCRGVCPSMRSTLGDMVYDRAIRRYIGVAQGRFVGQTSFYDAPQPWGPWTVIAYYNVDRASGSGGWANLGSQGGESLGVHIVNAWTSSDGLTLWMTYSSDGKAPRGALFPPEGTALDSFNLVSARLIPNTRADRAP